MPKAHGMPRCRMPFCKRACDSIACPYGAAACAKRLLGLSQRLFAKLCPADNDLDEPLLGYDSEAHRAAAGRGAGADGGGDSSGGSSALVPYSINAYDWADLVRGLVAGAVTSLRGFACGYCVSALCSFSDDG